MLIVRYQGALVREKEVKCDVLVPDFKNEGFYVRTNGTDTRFLKWNSILSVWYEEQSVTSGPLKVNVETHADMSQLDLAKKKIEEYTSLLNKVNDISEEIANKKITVDLQVRTFHE